MIPMRAIVVLVFAAILFEVHVIGSTGPVDFKNPVRSADEDEVKYSNDSQNAVKFYAGYLKAHDDGEPEQFLYYWFIECESSPATKPVVLWLNGGPGGSSLKLATFDIGPLALIRDQAPIVKKREYSWTKLANMLYIESPVGVGFSYGNLPRDYFSNDSTTAKANYLAMRSFVQKFPHFVNNPLYLTGASYAGVYVPTLAALIDKDLGFNLRGIAIENGMFALAAQEFAAIIFAYYHGLVDDKQWHRLSRDCCNNQPPARENCNFHDDTVELACRQTVRSIIDRTLGRFDANQRDNIYGTTLSERHLLRASPGAELQPRMAAHEDKGTCYWPKPSDLWVNFMDPKSRELIHVPDEVLPRDSISYCRTFEGWPRGVADNMTQLIESKRNLTILVFNGDTDIKCDYLGTKWFLEDLGRNTTSEYKEWRFNNRLAGFLQHFDGFTFATVLGGDHSPASSNPELGFKIIKSFLASEGKQGVEL